MDNFMNTEQMGKMTVGQIDTAWQAMAMEIEATLTLGSYYYVESYNHNGAGDLEFGTGCVTL